MHKSNFTSKLKDILFYFLFKVISERTAKLKSVKLKNNDCVDDSGLEKILMTQVNMEFLDISECRKINGHCLEMIFSRQLKEIKVAFDDFKLKCLENYFTELDMKRVRIVNKIIRQ